MSDISKIATFISPGPISMESPNCFMSDCVIPLRTGGSSAAWPVANRALYFPFSVERPVTVYQIGWMNGATVNNTANDMDVGIYDYLGNRLVSQGGTIVQTPINVLQLSDIADTTLTPGTYYMAMAVSNTTSTFVRFAPSALSIQVCGGQQQATALPLPNPATFANPGTAYVPQMVLALNATM